MPAAGKRQRRKLRCLRVFLSYAHRDEWLKIELVKHLSALRRSKLIESWDDRKISPGVTLDPEISRHLETAHLILLLVSPDFINSDYCYCVEMKTALKRHACGRARVVPVILRPVDWLHTPLGKLLALPTDSKPVTKWSRRDDAFLEIAKGIRTTVEDLRRENLVSKALRNTIRSKVKRINRLGETA
jgi:hypothetical protein